MSIATELAAILAAKYGQEVRQSIHDAIEQNYEDVVNGRIYMDGATDAANTAAALANTKAGLADSAATTANTKAGLADSAATTANTKAGLADSAATAANNAATLANTKAGLADSAAITANNAATLANTKAGLADSAAFLANANAEFATSAAILANTKAGLADSAATTANDAALKANAMTSGSPKGQYATLVALQSAFPTGDTGAYLVQADSHLYFWDTVTSAWVDGGEYNVAHASKVEVSNVDGYFSSSDVEGMMQEITTRFKDLDRASVGDVDHDSGISFSNFPVRSLVCIIADDSNVKSYTNIFPVTQETGTVVTAAISPGTLNTSGNMTSAQAKELQAAGWELAGHSNTHTPIAGRTYAELDEDTRLCAEGLRKLGSESKCFIYPFGGSSVLFRSVVRKYFNFGVGGTGIEIGKTVQNPWHIRRIDFEQTSLAGLKAYVDQIVANLGLFTIMMHGPDLDTEPNKQKLRDFIAYVASQNIDIVNASYAYSIFGWNLLLGDPNITYPDANYDPYIYLNKYGMKSDKNSLVMHEQENMVPGEGLPWDFPLGIYITELTADYVKANGYPCRYSGKLITNRATGLPNSLSSKNSSLQYFYSFGPEKGIYYRMSVSLNSWSGWLSASGMLERGEYTTLTPPGGWPLGISTIYIPTGTEGDSPNGVRGLLENHRMAENTPSFWFQNYYEYGSTAMYRRYGATSSTWSDWKAIGNVAAIPSKRAGFPAVGDHYFDTTKGKPVWCKTAGIRTKVKFTILTGATGSGTVLIRLESGRTTDVTEGETPTQIADRLRALTPNRNRAILPEEAGTPVITIRHSNAYKWPTSSVTYTEDAGVTISMEVLDEGLAPVYVDAAGTVVT